ncbi:Dynamitin like protein [Aduncisulcus paluster]|uniref:Dynamitin like protein n=1 Tax=Aduncisulcus paluster TaxID=2918883 RepID=A0ABQ5KPX6_9EUKA|nr:Dynamitin like protein [Aduncisulcus paluster]
MDIIDDEVETLHLEAEPIIHQRELKVFKTKKSKKLEIENLKIEEKVPPIDIVFYQHLKRIIEETPDSKIRFAESKDVASAKKLWKNRIHPTEAEDSVGVSLTGYTSLRDILSAKRSLDKSRIIDKVDDEVVPESRSVEDKKKRLELLLKESSELTAILSTPPHKEEKQKFQASSSSHMHHLQVDSETSQLIMNLEKRVDRLETTLGRPTSSDSVSLYKRLKKLEERIRVLKAEDIGEACQKIKTHSTDHLQYTNKFRDSLNPDLESKIDELVSTLDVVSVDSLESIVSRYESLAQLHKSVSKAVFSVGDIEKKIHSGVKDIGDLSRMVEKAEESRKTDEAIVLELFGRFDKKLENIASKLK